MPELESSSVPSPVKHDRTDPGPALGEVLSQDLREKIEHPERVLEAAAPSRSDSNNTFWLKTGLVVGVGLLLGARFIGSLTRRAR
jgi:hypothetical protein